MQVNTTSGNYLVSADPALLDLAVVHGYLSTESYWAQEIPLSIVQKALQHSLNFGVYKGSQQVGFARVITDYATFAYLCDVFILSEHRGLGLSKQLLAFILAHRELQGLRRLMLMTRDAHALYAQFGFEVIKDPGNAMARTRPGLYRKQNQPDSGTLAS